MNQVDINSLSNSTHPRKFRAVTVDWGTKDPNFPNSAACYVQMTDDYDPDLCEWITVKCFCRPDIKDAEREALELVALLEKQ